jgi:short-chain fatty acids transporter
MKKAIRFFTRICEFYLPDAFVFCLLLTLVVFILAAIFTPHSPLVLIDFWGKEFWSLNAFAMQMVFVLITGHMLAETPVVKKLIARITMIPKTESQGLVLVSLFSTIACFINWGFGLIVSGLLAVSVARKLGKVNFGLFVATAYAGFLVWHGGMSGSIPLKIAGGDEVLRKVYPGLAIPLSETIFSWWNLLIAFLLFVSVPVIALFLRTDEKVEVPHEEIVIAVNESGNTFIDRVEKNPVLHYILFGFFIVVLIRAFLKNESFDINRVNFVFLFLALFLHKSPRNFLKALQNSVGFASGIIIQFPFYAGLTGIMQHSGFADQISQSFVNVSTVNSFPFLAFLSGAIVNFFVPSGGGQWVVQGPIMMKAAEALGAAPEKIAMALAWGDGCTNMVQPFWALPLLALAKMQLKDMMGYSIIFMIWAALVIGSVLLIF